MIRIIVENDSDEQAVREALRDGKLSDLGQPFEVVRANGGGVGRIIGGGGAWGVTMAVAGGGAGFETYGVGGGGSPRQPARASR
jgi:hypothetical protein